MSNIIDPEILCNSEWDMRQGEIISTKKDKDNFIKKCVNNANFGTALKTEHILIIGGLVLLGLIFVSTKK